MQNIVETELFHNVKTRIYAMVEKITNVDSVAIFATADLEGIVSLAFLESAMMDAKIPIAVKYYHLLIISLRAKIMTSLQMRP